MLRWVPPGLGPAFHPAGFHILLPITHHGLVTYLFLRFSVTWPSYMEIAPGKESWLIRSSASLCSMEATWRILEVGQDVIQNGHSFALKLGSTSGTEPFDLCIESHVADWLLSKGDL